MTQFKVIRPHQGDKFYNVGDVREADDRDVAHLVASGTLEKMQPTLMNKAEPALKNKAAHK